MERNAATAANGVLSVNAAKKKRVENKQGREAGTHFSLALNGRELVLG